MLLVQILIEIKINHLFDNQKVMQFFTNSLQLIARIHVNENYREKVYVIYQIFHCKPLKQFINLIASLRDGNAAAT